MVVPTPTIPESFALEMDPSVRVRHTPEHKYPVLYLLHGGGNNHATWTGYTNVEMYAEEQQIIVVMFSAENKSYIDVPGNGILQDKFFRFLHEELPDFVTGMFPALTEPEHTYIAGLSLGGYGTMGVFSVGGSLPPQTDENGNPVERDPRWEPMKLAQKIKDEGRQFPKMYIACGDADPLYPSAVKLQEDMKALGADVTWVSRPGFIHEWRLWDEQVEAFLNWIPRTDFYAGSKRRI